MDNVIKICFIQATNAVDVKWSAPSCFGYLKTYTQSILPNGIEYFVAQNVEEAVRLTPDILGVSCISQDFNEAVRIMEGITGHLENNLNLAVNKEKSQVALVKNVTFLGVQILREKIRVSNKARLKFKAKVWVKMNKWQSVERREVRFVMDLKWFKKQGLIFLQDFTQRQQPLELTFSR